MSPAAPLDLVNHPLTLWVSNLLGLPHPGIALMLMAVAAFVLFVLFVYELSFFEAVLRYQTFSGGHRLLFIIWLPVLFLKIVLVIPMALFGAWAAYENATTIRDWWHRGNKSNR